MKEIFKLKNIWLFIPFFLFFCMCLQKVQNIPVWDDFNMPLDFILKYKEATLWGKLGMIWHQYGEHRLIPSKLIYITYYYLTGGLNFRILCLIGDLQLFFVGLIGTYFIKSAIKNWKFFSFIWMLCVFDLNTYENACMCMNAVGNYGVVMLFFLSMYFYDGKKIFWGVLFQVLCMYSNANGLISGILIAFFAFNKHRTLIPVWVYTAATALYFVGWHHVEIPNKLPFDINASITYFIRQSGAYFSFDNSFWIGLIVIGVLIYGFPYKYVLDKKVNPIICILLFSLGTMFAAVLFRANYSDAQFQTSRYLIYPQMMIATVLLFLFNKLSSKKGLAIGFVVCLLIYFTYTKNAYFGQAGFERTAMRAKFNKYFHPNPQSCDTICKKACVQGIYCIEDNR